MEFTVFVAPALTRALLVAHGLAHQPVGRSGRPGACRHWLFCHQHPLTSIAKPFIQPKQTPRTLKETTPTRKQTPRTPKETTQTRKQTARTPKETTQTRKQTARTLKETPPTPKQTPRTLKETPRPHKQTPQTPKETITKYSTFYCNY